MLNHLLCQSKYLYISPVHTYRLYSISCDTSLQYLISILRRLFFCNVCCYKCKFFFYVVCIVPLFCPAISFFMALFVTIVAIAIELIVFIAIIFVIVSGRSFFFVAIQCPTICAFVTNFTAYATFSLKLFLEASFQCSFFLN